MRLTSVLRSHRRDSDHTQRQNGDQREPLFTEALLSQLRRLAMASSRSISEGLIGEHRSKRRGASPEFADFKSYSPGDDFRRIDWNIYGRLDELFVRLSEVTTEMTVHVLIDSSASMDWQSDELLPTKWRYARQIAGALCYLSLWHFDRIVITPFGETLGKSFGPVQGQAQILPMLRFLTRSSTLGPTDLTAALNRYVRGIRRSGILLLISDLLSGEPEQFAEALHVFRRRGWQVIVVHILDRGELAPKYLAPIHGERAATLELVDVESHEKVRLLPTHHMLEQYETSLSGWLTQIERVCGEDATDYIRLQTDWPVESVALNLLRHRGILI